MYAIRSYYAIDLQASDARTDLQFVVKATEFKNILV